MSDKEKNGGILILLGGRMLQKRYNQYRLLETKTAPEQSRFFFAIWKNKNLFAAIKWFHDFKRNKQKLSFAWIRTFADLLGSTMVAFNIYLPLAIFLIIVIGGCNDETAGEG